MGENAAPDGFRNKHEKRALRLTPRLTILSLVASGLIVVLAYAAQPAPSSTENASTHSNLIDPHQSSQQEVKTMAQESNQSKDPVTPTTENSTHTTTVTVNGKTVTVPANGTYSQTTTDGNGKTNVQINSHSSSTASGSGSSVSNNSSSNIRVNVQSNSSSESNSN